MIKKISAVLIALVLCLSMMVVPASAAVELGSAQMSFSLEWDKESYSAGETAVLSIYMDAADDLSLYTGSFIIGLNSSVISQDDNTLDDIRANSETAEWFAAYYKDGTTNLSWLAATVDAKVDAANTAEEQALYDQYVKFTAARNSAGSHENVANSKDGFHGDEFDPADPILKLSFTLAADIPDGTVLNAAMTSGSLTCSPVQTTWKYYKTPGSATTTANITAANIDVSQTVATSTIGEPAAHVCTPAEAVQENVVNATCGTDGSYESVVYCSVCKEEISRTPVTVPATGEHVYAKEIEKVEPTCTEDGYVVKACGCSDDVNVKETLPATGHSESKVVTKPTCTETGYTTYTCSTCKNVRIADEVPANGHDYRAKVTAPTCTEAGYTTYTCPFCKDSYVADNTDPTGHSYESVVTDPTCTEAGYTTHTCTVDKCGYSYTDSETNPTGHSHEVIAVKQPTCSKAGFTRYKCACGDSYDVEIPSKNHTNEDGSSALVEIPEIPATCKNPGYTAGEKCKLCNTQTIVPQQVPTSEHAWDDGVVTEPTYTEQGYTTFTCTVCDETKKDNFTDKKQGFDVEIEEPASTEVAEGETVTLKAPVTGSGFTVKWTANNENFAITENADGSIDITPIESGKTTFTVTVYDEDGVKVSEDTIEMTAVVEGDDSDNENWLMSILEMIINFFKMIIQAVIDLIGSIC